MRALKMTVVAMVAAAALMSGSESLAQDDERFRLLATSRTGTMQEELNEAGAAGYRFRATQGGETAFGGNEAVVVMERDPDGGRFRYVLLATSRTGTMQEELNDLPPEYQLVGFTVFSSRFGGSEAAAILEAPATE